MEKIGINIVGVGPSSDDVSTQLLNISGGFRGVIAKIVSRDTDCLYLGITSDRAYIVTVEGDLVLSTETSDSFDSKIAGVTGFDIDWTLTAKQFGNGSGKIIVTNPDAPSEVSTFEVFMGEPRSVVVEYAANTGCLVLDIFENSIDTNHSGRSGMSNEVRHTKPVGHEFGHEVAFPHFVGSRNFSARGDLDLVIIEGSVLDGLVDHPSFARPGVPLLVVGDFNEGYHRPGDFCAHGPSVECTLVDALLGGLGFQPKNSDHGPVLVRASLEDLMASFGADGDGDGDAVIEIEPSVRDFSQLARTRSNDLERIEQAVAKANALGIDTSNVAFKRDAALARLSVFSDRFESGGEQTVTEAEVAVIHTVFGELWSIHSDLDTLVSHWDHYKGHEANHDAWEKRLADRKRNFKVVEGEEGNRIVANFIAHAANPGELLTSSKAAFVELFAAIQRGDLQAAHKADQQARQFSTREHMLDALIRRGKLVVVEEVSTAA